MKLKSNVKVQEPPFLTVKLIPSRLYIGCVLYFKTPGNRNNVDRSVFSTLFTMFSPRKSSWVFIIYRKKTQRKEKCMKKKNTIKLCLSPHVTGVLEGAKWGFLNTQLKIAINLQTWLGHKIVFVHGRISNVFWIWISNVFCRSALCSVSFALDVNISFNLLDV